MRVSAFSSKQIKTKDLIPIIQGSLDTGYSKKKTKWYKKLLGFVVFAVAFYFSGPLAIGIAGAGAATVAVVAVQLAIATLAVSLLSAAMMMWGDEMGSMAVGRFAQKVSVVSSIVGIMAIVSSVAGQIAKAASQLATKAATEGAIKAALDYVKDYVISVFKKYTTDLSLERGIISANRIFNMYSKNKLDKLSDRLKSLEAQNAENSQYEEENMARDIGRALIKSHAELLHQDSDDRYDYMYESWKGPMHTGNIQRTSWKWVRTGAKDGLSTVRV